MPPTYSRDEILRKLQRGDKLDRADLRGLDLSKQRLAKAVFDRADLEGVNFEGAELAGASMRRANMREAYLVNADLSGANLENADLEGARLDGADLSGANLNRANLEGANLTGANLSGAQLGYAQLATAKLGNANLAEAVFTHAELDEAYLGAVLGGGARFNNARLAGANLDDARFPGAIFDEASLRNASLRNVDFTNTSFIRTDLSLADLTNANLSGADIRHANFTQAVITGARLTGAKAAGLVGTGSPPSPVEVTWLDLSPAGDGSQRIENGVIPSVLTLGAIATVKPPTDGRRRYFGRGDVLRNAVLEFEPGAHVEIDSLFRELHDQDRRADRARGRCVRRARGLRGHRRRRRDHSRQVLRAASARDRRASRGRGQCARCAGVRDREERRLDAVRVRERLPAACEDPWAETRQERGEVMSDKDIVSAKHTLVEEGTELKGTIKSNVPIVVMGKVDGEVTAPVVHVSASGVVAGKVKVTELRSSGEIAGEIEAETVHIAGRVRDKTVIRARTLEVSLSRDKGGIEVLFGECELNIGDAPDKQAAIDAALAAPEVPKAAPATVVTTKAPRRKGSSEAWDASDVASATPPPPEAPAEEGGETRKRKTMPPPIS